MNKKITENDLYAKLRKEREELYKIIGKEEITDQKVRIDKYAHLYVLQDEMTELCLSNENVSKRAPKK